MGIERLLVRDSTEMVVHVNCVVYLSKALFLLLNTGSTQEERKSFRHD